MRKALLTTAIALTAALAVSGCVNNRTGEVGQKNIRPNSVNGYDNHRLSLNGTHSYGSPTYRTRFANDQGNEQNRMLGRNRMGNGVVGPHDNYRLESSHTLASQISALPEVDDAYVLLSDKNAYVGVTLFRRSGTSTYAAGVDNRLRSKIADKVKAAAPGVQKVFVSSHPEFVERMQTYALPQGRPAQDFLEEFNALSARMFPASNVRNR
ncbi:YhcN/YlaJ family sporulation lipoprotein [Cohnella caldifontis]|uniref:YhcN/YlaJ family sporulation lipoprotein n=1 Tax=Cohnella caldifontis TaxID=3027471 RepID=UPI0023ECCDAE|nr:YhcN/YlaJ family sporulation lipoprotein [Cohnella sp. YIM B05605]